LLRYLYAPGKRNEHMNPRLVAAWDGAGDLSQLEPSVGDSGKRDFRELIDLLERAIRPGARFHPHHFRQTTANHASAYRSGSSVQIRVHQSSSNVR
jgi:hypothetical protein